MSFSQKREALEDVKELEPYRSLLDDDLEKLSDDESEEDERETKKERPKVTYPSDYRNLTNASFSSSRVVVTDRASVKGTRETGGEYGRSL